MAQVALPYFGLMMKTPGVLVMTTSVLPFASSLSGAYHESTSPPRVSSLEQYFSSVHCVANQTSLITKKV
jgi:hypothetical protein